MVGKTAALALAAVVALAGCAQVSAETVARDAADDLQAAWTGAAGSLQRMDLRLRMGLGEDASFDLAGAVELHEDDAVTMTLRVEEARLGDPGAEEAFQDLGFLLYCSPGRWVLRTEGMAAIGMEDADAETANSADGCMGGDAGTVGDMQRLLRDLDPMFAGMIDSLSLEPPPMELVEASWEGDDVLAVYEIRSEGMTMRVTATIRDDQIVRSEGGFDAGGMGSMSLTTEYHYGPRSADPGLRGAEQV